MKRSIAAMVITAISLFTSQASAALVTYDFLGFVDDIAFSSSPKVGLFEGALLGDFFSGSFTIDTDGPLDSVFDLGPAGMFKTYDGDHSITIDGTVYDGLKLEVGHDAVFDEDYIAIDFDLPSTPGSTGTFALGFAGGAFGALDIPALLPFPYFYGFVSIIGGPSEGDDFGILLDVSLAETSGLPGPGAVLLLVVGLAGFGVLRRCG